MTSVMPRQVLGLSVECHDFGATGTDQELLRELSSFRGEVLYADGRRPVFQRPDGTFADLQEYDEQAVHIVLRDKAGSLVGAIRLHRAELHPTGQVESAFGATPATRLISGSGVKREDVLEGGRLIVAASHQGAGLGGLLLVTAHQFARSTGRKWIWGVVGTADAQEDTFVACGYRTVPGLEAVSVEYDDVLRLVYLDLRSNQK